MALHYILDGYNIIKQDDRLADLPLESGREALFKRLRDSQPQGSVRNSITIVFDGQPDVFGGAKVRGLKVVFTKGESADDRIKKLIESAKNKTVCVVVTDDREIQYYVRSLGAQILSVREFISRGVKSASEQKTSGLSSSEADQITDELQNIWVKKKKRD